MHSENFTTGFDFNPAGDSIASIDSYGVCLISDVNTNNYVFHFEDGIKYGNSEFYKYSSLIWLIILSTFWINLMIASASFVFCWYSLDWTGRCRWSFNIGEPLLFVKFKSNKLNLLDVEKKALILRIPVELEKSGICN